MVFCLLLYIKYVLNRNKQQNKRSEFIRFPDSNMRHKEENGKIKMEMLLISIGRQTFRLTKLLNLSYLHLMTTMSCTKFESTTIYSYIFI